MLIDKLPVGRWVSGRWVGSWWVSGRWIPSRLLMNLDQAALTYMPSVFQMFFQVFLKHFSNIIESIKVTHKIVLPYVKEKQLN